MVTGSMLYVHIPFCERKCPYCAFNSLAGREEAKGPYMAALLRQLEREMERFRIVPGGISSVFMGGGTPSAVAAPLYEPLFARIAPFLAPGAEVTTEANPGSADREWLATMKSLGVNRVSFGVQSFRDDKLEILGRVHNGKTAVEAVETAAALGLERISADLIYGLAGESWKAMERDLETAFSLPLDHLSCYQLTIEEGTPFQATPERAADDPELARKVAERITAEGFEWYEVSNFGKTRSAHNLGYWKHRDYMGVGAGAVGFRSDTRFMPVKELEAYLANPLAETVEHLSAEDLRSEKLFLGFRSVVGVERSLVKDETRLAHLLEAGKVREEGDRLYAADFFLADELALYLI